MNKLLITFTLLVVAFSATAAKKGLLCLTNDNAPSGCFISSFSQTAAPFDLWQVDSGYVYSLNNNLELYLGTRLFSGKSNKYASREVLSGVKYYLTPKVSIKSAVTSETVDRDTMLGVEFSSQYKVTHKVNLHAAVDYEALEQIYQLGIGYRF